MSDFLKINRNGQILNINPLMLLAEGQGAVAADALISLNAKPASDHAK